MTITLSTDLPAYPTFTEGIRRAPDRGYRLTPAQTETALRNALRYIPVELHEQLAPELMDELLTRGKIYGYRFRPEGDLKAKPIDEYKGNCIEGKAFQVMIDNNLSFDIALYPYELVTYGETGQVCQNWMQYRLIKQYLEVMTNEQTLVVESGHPLGLFKSHPEAPRVIITNSMMVGMFDNQKDWEIAAQMGVANYGQMTAGGWMYIGPQGIVHGTFNTLLNAGRMKLGVPQDGNLNGHLFVSSGLGGMSGAQPKAAEIAGAVAIIAEVDYSRIETRHRQGWVQHITSDLSEAYRLAADAIDRRIPCSIAYHGNVVNLLEYALHHNIHIELLSDQTSCHAVYEGGYCPAGISFEERTRMLKEDRETFDEMVNETLRRHFHVIKELVARGTYFFDYGNSFMKAIYDAGVKEISRNGTDEKDGFIWPCLLYTSWMGVTVTRSSEKRRIDDLKKNIKARHYHVTFEPLFDDIGEIDFEGIDWIVIGTETGNRKGKSYSRPEWVLSIAEQAKAHGIPVFMKEDLLPIMGDERMIQELPEQFTRRIQ